MLLPEMQWPITTQCSVPSDSWYGAAGLVDWRGPVNSTVPTRNYGPHKNKFVDQTPSLNMADLSQAAPPDHNPQFQHVTLFETVRLLLHWRRPCGFLIVFRSSFCFPSRCG